MSPGLKKHLSDAQAQMWLILPPTMAVSARRDGRAADTDIDKSQRKV